MASSRRPAMILPCLLTIFVCLLGLGNAGYPQPLPTGLEPQERSADLVEEKIAFGDPNSYDHVLRLPTEKDDSISMQNPQERPHEPYPKWEPRFPVQRRPFIIPQHSELGSSQSEDDRQVIFGWPFRFGRPGGCVHRRRTGDHRRPNFPGTKAPDSIALRLDFDGVVGASPVFPTQTQSTEFRPQHRFGPGDMGESAPYDSAVINEDVVREHSDRGLAIEAVARPHEEQHDRPAGRWMGLFHSFSHRP